VGKKRLKGKGKQGRPAVGETWQLKMDERRTANRQSYSAGKTRSEEHLARRLQRNLSKGGQQGRIKKSAKKKRRH